ncbi:bacteriocin family protein [Ruminococcaceae bacterium OttesenSCG-928-O06]|nr:bacteriocin family protein [Ruminococcaceae bacterium OttesenSCG-928-O06]
MDYLSRGDAPFSEELWGRIDAAVTGAAKDMLVARRFLPLYGPLGPGAATARIDGPQKEEVQKDGFAMMEGRALAQVPQLFEDFWLYWRDLAQYEQDGVPVDLAAAKAAAQSLAWREDEMVFYGVKEYGIEGLLTAKGVNTQKRGDWATGENAFTDVAAAVATLNQNRKIGRHTLIVSQDLYVQLQRIQPSTGVLESKRVAKLLDGRLFYSAVLQPKTALLVSAQAQYMDLVVGQDIRTAFTEAVDLNYHLRVLETALPRVKDPTAVVVFK